jgi:formiminotetrahydrofolate cyclodeaminase
MIKPVEYNGENLWVTFDWPKSKPSEGYCYLYKIFNSDGRALRDVVAAGHSRRNPKDTNNRKVARQEAFGRMLKGAGDILPVEVLQQLRQNFDNRGKG